MKYLSLLLFTVALVLTWKVIHKDPEITFETHSGIQEKLAVFIVDTIKAKKPTATDISIEKVWTEPTGENQVKAFFIYSFKDKTAEGVVATQIQGEGILERQGMDESGADRWQLTKVQTTNDAIVFDDAMIVTPGGGDDSEGAKKEEAPTAASENKAENKAEKKEETKKEATK